MLWLPKNVSTAASLRKIIVIVPAAMAEGGDLAKEALHPRVERGREITML